MDNYEGLNLQPGQYLVEDIETGKKYVTTCSFYALAGLHMDTRGPMIPVEEYTRRGRLSHVIRLYRDFLDEFNKLSAEEQQTVEDSKLTMKDFTAPLRVEEPVLFNRPCREYTTEDFDMSMGRIMLH